MATNRDHSVTSLQDLATDVFFKKIIYKATPRKVESIRNWTDQQLVGRVKKAFRYIYSHNSITELNRANEFHFHFLFQGEMCEEVE